MGDKFTKSIIRPGFAIQGPTVKDVFKAFTGAPDNDAKKTMAGLGHQVNQFFSESIPPYLGFIENDPAVVNPNLGFVHSFFSTDQGSIPLTPETYNAFNKKMYQAFLNGQIPGKVSYFQPSIQEVAQVLRSQGLIGETVDFTRTKDASRINPQFYLDSKMNGIPGLDEAPSSGLKKRKRTS